jgi:hypothetical protein
MEAPTGVSKESQGCQGIVAVTVSLQVAPEAMMYRALRLISKRHWRPQKI